MSQENSPRHTTLPLFNEVKDPVLLADYLRKVTDAVNSGAEGGQNNHFRVTLATDAVTTDLINTRCHSQSTCVLTPQSASAAVALAAGAVWVVTESGKAVIHHDASSEEDRTFGAAFFN